MCCALDARLKSSAKWIIVVDYEKITVAVAILLQDWMIPLWYLPRLPWFWLPVHFYVKRIWEKVLGPAFAFSCTSARLLVKWRLILWTAGWNWEIRTIWKSLWLTVPLIEPFYRLKRANCILSFPLHILCKKKKRMGEKTFYNVEVACINFWLGFVILFLFQAMAYSSVVTSYDYMGLKDHDLMIKFSSMIWE